MAAKYTDQEITMFINERKPLPDDYRSKIKLKEKRGHKEKELDAEGENGNKFSLILRQSNINPLDFSIILVLCPPDTTQPFRLRRYNGKSHEHTNHIEGNTFYSFHVHMATERYQELGTREDTYAEPVDSFDDVQSALRSMFNDCGFDVPQDPQPVLFEEV
ncbi:MAG TPA: hypothetical protein ENG83_13285 [Nitrospirae bacterium]|nr:hypothetical protein BMS3Abin06_01803 [bacterium BMS3Abin06]HDH13149.1 hypothetical protein [Nitrospirota bacterium]HDZ03295.1 hypothetical protein [Nitrospirota bacterium]